MLSKNFTTGQKRDSSRINATGPGVSGSGYGRLLTVLMLNLILATGIFGQHVENKGSGADQELRSSGRVNPSSLGMEMDIPLGSYPGRGINVPISLSYSSKLWRMEYLSSTPPPGAGGGCRSVNDARFSENSASGWTTSLAVPYIEYTGKDTIYKNDGFPFDDDLCDPGASSNYSYAYIRRLTIHLPSGETHELRYNDTPVIYPPTSNCVNPTPDNPCDPNDPSLPQNWNRIYRAVDGSNIKYIQESSSNTYKLLMPDGSYYEFDSGEPVNINGTTARKATGFTDLNSNHTTYNGSDSDSNAIWTDTLGRTLTAPIGAAAPDAPTTRTYSMPGQTGTYKFYWKKLEDGLTTPQALKYPGDYGRSNNNSSWVLIPENTSSLFHSSNKGYVEAQQLFNPVVLTKIELPTGQSYQFSYDIYGRIDKIDYPTGGEETFVYNTIKPLAEAEPGNLSDQTNFGVTNRKVYPTAGQGTPYQWNYGVEYTAPAGYKVSVTSPDGTVSQRILHRGNSFCPNCTIGSFGYDNGLAGMPFEELNYSSSGQIVSRKLTHWTVTSFAVPNGNQTADWHPRVDYDESIAYDTATGDGVSATTRYEFEGNLSQRETPVLVNKSLQYAFVAKINTGSSPISPPDPTATPNPNPTPVPTPVPPTLLRTTETTYSMDAAYLDQNMVGLATSSTVRDGAETIVARSEMIYDETGYSPVGRGNPTTARVWDSTKGEVTNPAAYLSTHARFDTDGNQYQSIDAKGTTTMTAFDTTRAYPVSVTTSVPDPSGVNGSSQAFTTGATFDPTTGLPQTTTDANGQVTTFEYDPVTLRPKKVIPPAGAGTSETFYNDAPNNYWVKNKTQIDTNKWAESFTYYDGLGRAYKTEQVDTVQGNVFVEKEFDAQGRVSRVTNPFRATETKFWTTNVYDESSRVKEVDLQDGASVKTDYGVATTGMVGITKQITDQANNQRKGITDALGRMTRVIEDPAGQNLSTDYVFDTLGNLRETTQGVQHRYFNYDSLGRLLYAKQPEQEANTAFAATDAITSNTQWSVKYVYDDNGNITTTTDARGVSVTGTYDKFNRLIYRDYSDPATPDVSFYYDGTGLGAVPAYSKGKTTKVSSSVSESRYTSFDNLGRLLASEQRTPFSDTETIANATPRVSSYLYNLSGALKQQTYPSGRVVTNEFDADGALSRVAGNAAGQTQKTYANSFSYTAAGAVKSMKLGNDKWESAKYNSRLQVEEMGLGNAAIDTSLLKLSFGYGTAAENNGSMRSQTMVVPTDGASQGFTATQTYDYDELNRLKTAEEKVSNATTWKQTFNYDRYGNRTFDAGNTIPSPGAPTKETNPSINPSDNRLTKDQDNDSVTDYDFDKNGNLTLDAANQRFVYDAENHLKGFFKSTNNTSTPDATYLYDGEGKRVKKISYLEITIFVYDGGGQLVAEYSTQTSATPQTSYLTEDHLGSPRIITNQAGAVISRKDFKAFGEEAVATQRATGLGYKADDIRQDYTGYQKDEESGLEYAQARYYNSSHGRFTSVDPLTASASIRDPQTFNRYSYVLNSPYKFSDPLGLLPQSTRDKGSDWEKMCGFSCRVKNAAEFGTALSKQDIALLQFHISNGTALGYSYQNAVQSRQSQRRNQTESLPPPRTVALASKVSKHSSEENAFLNRAKKATSEVAQFSQGSDIISALMEFSESGSIDEIIIHDHGFPGGIIGDGNNVGLYTTDYANQIPQKNFPGIETTESFSEFVKSGKIDIASNGAIVIFGCNCSNVAQELSSKLGAIGRSDISVTGANNAVYEKNGSAYVDKRSDGISAGSRGSFITYKNGIKITTSTTRSYK